MKCDNCGKSFNVFKMFYAGNAKAKCCSKRCKDVLEGSNYLLNQISKGMVGK